MTVNIPLAHQAARDLMLNLGFDLQDCNYRQTPERLTDVLLDFTQGLRGIDNEIEKNFEVLFAKHTDSGVPYQGMLVQSPIRVYSLCSHHLLPVIYDIAFAYIPKKGEQIGFSKIVRILRLIAKRPMNQEDFTQKVVDLFFNKLRPKGLAVVISGVHMCMKMRGVCSEAVNKTSAVKGDFKDYERTRDEFLTLAVNFNHQL